MTKYRADIAAPPSAKEPWLDYEPDEEPGQPPSLGYKPGPEQRWFNDLEEARVWCRGMGGGYILERGPPLKIVEKVSSDYLKYRCI
jgi:hypothetical protein